MQSKSRILIVEDEPAIRMGLVDVFVFHGYDVDSAERGDVGLAKVRGGNFDLIILDVMLPGMSGFEVCEAIRAADADQPIIMLTARVSDDDVIHGLSLGADDYVVKPFSVAQLVLRVEAVLRRARPVTQRTPLIALGDDVRIDTGNLRGTRGETRLTFTRREMDVLQHLHAHAGNVVSREALLTHVWGYARDLELETRTVDIHVAKIRRKIEADPKQPRYLVTIRGAGYQLDGVVEP
jgi:two-component system response regulator RegX3